MSTEYRIGGSTKSWMLTLALIFDGIQFITPGIMDTMITAMAALVFGMMFLERGALTQSGSGALKLFRFITPFAEIFISHLPGITLIIWIQIRISRFYDLALPDQIHSLVGLKRLRGDIKDITQSAKTVSHQKTQLKKYAKGSIKRSYGKGRRGAATLARKTGQHANLAKRKVGRSVEQAQRRLTGAKLTP